MKLLLWFSVHVGLSRALAFQDAETLWGPRPAPAQPNNLSPRGGVPGWAGRSRGGRGGRRQSGQPINIDLTVWKPKATEMQWYGDITVGTPPQTFKLLFDTGAPFMLLPRDTCTDCGAQHTLFNPSQSSTFSIQPGYSVSVYFGGTTSTGEQENANCTVVSDTVRMAGHAAPNQEFLLCHTYSEGLREHTPDGLFGLGSTLMNTWYSTSGDPLSEYTSVYYQLVASGELPGPEFGISYIGNAVRDGVLTLGGTDTSLYKPETLTKVPLDWPLSESRNRWVVGITSAWVRPGLDTNEDAHLLANTSDAVALVDTGTPNMVTPDHDTAVEIYSVMSDLIEIVETRGFYNYWGAPCGVLDNVSKEVWFRFGSGSQTFDAVVKAEHLNEGEFDSRPGWCKVLFASPRPEYPAREPNHGRPAWIVGNKLLKSYYTVWNAADHTLGFALHRENHYGKKRNC